MKEPRWEVFQSDEDGLWYFHLKAPNGKIMLPSEGYVSRRNVNRALDVAIGYASVAEIVELEKKT